MKKEKIPRLKNGELDLKTMYGWTGNITVKKETDKVPAEDLSALVINLEYSKLDYRPGGPEGARIYLNATEHLCECVMLSEKTRMVFYFNSLPTHKTDSMVTLKEVYKTFKAAYQSEFRKLNVLDSLFAIGAGGGAGYMILKSLFDIFFPNAPSSIKTAIGFFGGFVGGSTINLLQQSTINNKIKKSRKKMEEICYMHGGMKGQQAVNYLKSKLTQEPKKYKQGNELVNLNALMKLHDDNFRDILKQMYLEQE